MMKSKGADVKGSNRTNRVKIAPLVSPAGLFAIVLFILSVVLGSASPVIAGEQKHQELVTIRNEAYGFEVTIPKVWSFKKAIQADPDEGMRTGEASFSISVGGSEKEPENWNGIAFNSSGTSDNPRPFVSIYAHEKPDQKPEEFADLFEATVAGFNGKILSMNREFSIGDAKGFSYTYNLFIKSRYVALYRNGMRVVVHYFFPASDTTLFERHSSEVDSVIRSLRIK
jgi:hypothetical protein